MLQAYDPQLEVSLGVVADCMPAHPLHEYEEARRRANRERVAELNDRPRSGFHGEDADQRAMDEEEREQTRDLERYDGNPRGV